MALLISFLRKYHPAIPVRSVLLLLLLIHLPAFSGAQTMERRAEDNIKAAYLYKFCDYVEWPDDMFITADSTITIGVLGADNLAEDLEKIVINRQVQGRNITVRKLKIGDPITGIHMLFIGRSQGQQIEEIIMGARTQSILTVTEREKITSSGSVINFVVIDNRVRFDVALAIAKKSNLKISSRLLSVARNVINETS